MIEIVKKLFKRRIVKLLYDSNYNIRVELK